MLRTLPHDTNWEQRIRQVAYEYWEERGRPIGSSEVDWFRAEKEIDRQLNPCVKTGAFLVNCLELTSDKTA